MILSDIARIIDAAPSDLQTAKIVDERLLTLRELGVLFGMSEAKLRRMWPAVICRSCVLAMKTVTAFARSNGA